MENGTIRIDIQRDKESIKMVYGDDGRGMSDEQKEKAFDPFFTTKRGKGGTGLGMSIVFNLVTQTLKGSIELESTMGKGVNFTMTFPEHWDKN